LVGALHLNHFGFSQDIAFAVPVENDMDDEVGRGCFVLQKINVDENPQALVVGMESKTNHIGFRERLPEYVVAVESPGKAFNNSTAPIVFVGAIA